MRIEQLIAFEKVVRCGSFTKAANELYTTQPSVSKMIDSLESELEQRLVLRTSHGIELTPSGRRIYSDVKVILRMVTSWQEISIDCISNQHQGVHIQSTTTMCDFLSANFIDYLLDAEPCIDVFLHESRKSELIHEMWELGVRIGVLPLRDLNLSDVSRMLEQVQKNGWESYTLFQDPLRLFVSTKSPLAEKDIITIKDLENITLGTYTDAQDDNWLLFSRYFNGNANCRRHSKENILQAVAEDRCTAIFPLFTSQPDYLLKTKKICPVIIEDLDLGYVNFSLIHHPSKSLLESEQIVINHLKVYFAQLNH